MFGGESGLRDTQKRDGKVRIVGAEKCGQHEQACAVSETGNETEGGPNIKNGRGTEYAGAGEGERAANSEDEERKKSSGGRRAMRKTGDSKSE